MYVSQFESPKDETIPNIRNSSPTVKGFVTEDKKVPTEKFTVKKLLRFFGWRDCQRLHVGLPHLLDQLLHLRLALADLVLDIFDLKQTDL